MNKTEFKDFLNDRLSILEDTEKNEVIEEYIQHIEMKVENGQSEEDAIKDFGDLEEFTKEILSAYHVKQTKKPGINDYVKSMDNLIDKTSDALSKVNRKKLISIVFEFMLLLVGIMIFRAFFYAFVNFIIALAGFGTPFDGIFHIPYSVTMWFENMFKFVLEIGYFVIAGFTIITFVKKRVISLQFTEKKNTSSSNDEKVEDTVVDDQQPHLNEEEKVIDAAVNVSKVKKAPKVKKESQFSATQLLVGFVVLIARFFSFFFLIGILPVTVTMVVMFGVSFGMLVQSAGLWGLTLILFGVMLICISTSVAIAKFVFKGGK